MSTFERPSVQRDGEEAIETVDNIASLVDLMDYYSDSEEALEIVRHFVTLIRNVQNSPNAIRVIKDGIPPLEKNESLPEPFKEKLTELLLEVVGEFNKQRRGDVDVTRINKIIYGDNPTFDPYTPHTIDEEISFSSIANMTFGHSSYGEGVKNQKKLLENEKFVETMNKCETLEALAKLFRDAKQGFTEKIIVGIIQDLETQANDEESTMTADFEAFVKTRIAPHYSYISRNGDFRPKLNELIRERLKEIGISEKQINEHLPSLPSVGYKENKK